MKPKYEKKMLNCVIFSIVKYNTYFKKDTSAIDSYKNFRLY